MINPIVDVSEQFPLGVGRGVAFCKNLTDYEEVQETL